MTRQTLKNTPNGWIRLRPGHTWNEWLAHAQKAADKAWRLDPTLPPSKGARAAVLMFTGRTHEAIALSEQQIAMNPSELIARHDLAALLLFSGQPERVANRRAQEIAFAIAIFLALVAGTPSASIAQIARTKVLTFPSVTLTDQEFLTGRKDGKSETVGGVLRLPAGTGKVPVAVLLHGSGGISSYVTDWEDDFNALGMGTFIIDSFSPRGIVNTNADQFVLGRLAMIVDAYNALEALSKHPRVDPSRIVLMGFSRGGQTALYASVARFQRTYMPAGVSFAAYVTMYAQCGTTFRDDDDMVDRPVRMFHGIDDNYVSIEPCRAYAARLKAKGRDVQLTEYPGAGHVFDGKAFKKPLAPPNWQTMRHCTLAEADAGAIFNAKSGQPFTASDPVSSSARPCFTTRMLPGRCARRSLTS
ncbi:dienelactone hydrolase family protein [Variovorax ginsengisoli]|uniref:Alpha/beta hydrolase fold domain-containing protein n=1 Tax=Variovorax ginsengisoli TaxID=363844 RepID=A0ABT8S5N4_9BURK|nr:dienelactone hydrolase family protein [Variovorax ginsengisoli]MDN8613516.1 alpha/beta hydrolase fold domain-containing protein [Variovorax ginsengisoli]MDO1532686.1 alpha/beta hydrolase fold domain-containing protein [Variovorax ginsengisoli]